MARLGGYDHVSLSVSDADRSAAWYVEALAFVEVRRVKGERFERVILLHPESQIALGLTCHEQDGERRSFNERQIGMDHMAFSTDGREELIAWKARLEEMGIDHSEIKDTPTGALITLRDPDNIQIEIRAAAPAPS